MGETEGNPFGCCRFDVPENTLNNVAVTIDQADARFVDR
jgi:hypothetical protein